MEVKQVLHMKAGEGQESYAQNSTPQRLTIFMVKPIFEEIIRALLSRFKVADCIRIADLGCSSGPNTLAQVEVIINIIDKICSEVNRKQPSTQFFLNDLESNDFNNTFKLLPSFYNQLGNSTNRKLGSCFIAAMPGSFYTRLFPKESLHFVCSSNSLHWLSQVHIEPGVSLEADFLSLGIEYCLPTTYPSQTLTTAFAVVGIYWIRMMMMILKFEVGRAQREEERKQNLALIPAHGPFN